MPTVRELVELFHLLFLDQFGRKTEKNLYALKGGCNLRFFLKSVRYSEDIDLDIHTVAKETLANKVDRILESAPFHAVLKSRGLEINEISKPKQTETGQRWKLSVTGPSTSLAARTKIEFSRRTFDDGFKFESINPALALHYGLYPILINHYGLQTAYAQKVGALVARKETQARDIFDLDLLLRSGAKGRLLPVELTSEVEDAIETTYSVSFEDFKGQVIAFLEPEYQSQYDSNKMWDEMVLRVVDALKEGKP
jgi:predicted nucleotidyltransferase component of viral defense system